MALFPEIDIEFEIEDEELIDDEEEEALDTTIGNTPLYDFSKGEYVIQDGKLIYCTQEEAVKQWLGFLIKTPAERFNVYNEIPFGTYISNLLGYKDIGFIASEVEREIKEKCIDNRAITGISNFKIKKEGGKLEIAFSIVTAEGLESEVITNVN